MGVGRSEGFYGPLRGHFWPRQF
ncbi:hypothetical protein BLAT2472_170007 [Burkholderia latens]